MTLLHHRRTVPTESVTTPFWSLTLPYWAEAQRAESRPAHEPRSTSWTCAKCGSVVDGISAAYHIDVHRAQERTPPETTRCEPGRVRAGRWRSAIGPTRKRGGARL
jgi:hypothetical protein